MPISSGQVTEHITIADFDGDGTPEIAIAGTTSSSLVHGEIRLYEQTGLLRRVLLPSGNDPSSSFGWTMATGDLDGDGFTDLVVADPSQDQTGVIYVIPDPLECP